ncbi:MAG: hypothetical protein GY927_05515 [bacterium]|nr:hypothetical protein [bacterium]
MKNPRQLALDLAHRPAFGAEDFFLSQSNELAVKLIDDWPHWAQYAQLLIGPEASGKTHLVNVWILRSQAHVIEACNLHKTDLQQLSLDQCICIENLHDGLASEDALFHLLNKVNESGGQLFLTSQKGIGDLALKLNDLRSRLLALPSVSINAPDENLLKAVMIKQFNDRQIEIEPQLVEYLSKRMERSLQAVTKIVDDLDRGSLGAGRAITRVLAREILLDKSS